MLFDRTRLARVFASAYNRHANQYVDATDFAVKEGVEAVLADVEADIIAGVKEQMESGLTQQLVAELQMDLLDANRVIEDLEALLDDRNAELRQLYRERRGDRGAGL